MCKGSMSCQVLCCIGSDMHEVRQGGCQMHLQITLLNLHLVRNLPGMQTYGRLTKMLLHSTCQTALTVIATTGDVVEFLAARQPLTRRACRRR